MKVLIACEYSGIIRDAFLDKGHEAISCDLLPSESSRGGHYMGNVLDIINDGWDLLIGHPPCTFLSYAGTAHWNQPGRIKKRLEALEFFRILWESPIEKICLENPKGCASPVIAKYSQEIQPYYFGDSELKTTWLWLKNLPLLIHSEDDNLFYKKTHTEKPQPRYVEKSGKVRYFTESIGHSNTQAKRRSKTFLGIAQAMAEQWG
jgi:hypothetical protein